MKRLKLKRETLRDLSEKDLVEVHGGAETTFVSCGQVTLCLAPTLRGCTTAETCP